MKDYSFNEFVDIIRTLRSENGCPWDREQTHESLKTCLIEECYETVDAIDNKDSDNLCEELGDLLLQVIMHSVIAEEEGSFSTGDVVSRVSEKMIRRHPHVFGDVSVSSSGEVLKNWEEIKKSEKKDKSLKNGLLSIPKAFPAAIRAEKALKKASNAGLVDINAGEVLNSLASMADKLKRALENSNNDQISDLYEDLCLATIKLSLVLQLNAEYSLTNATNKFINKLVDVF
jgi:tetrapyrrole methylase family protein/MazG family protein